MMTTHHLTVQQQKNNSWYKQNQTNAVINDWWWWRWRALSAEIVQWNQNMNQKTTTTNKNKNTHLNFYDRIERVSSSPVIVNVMHGRSMNQTDPTTNHIHFLRLHLMFTWIVQSQINITSCNRKKPKNITNENKWSGVKLCKRFRKSQGVS